jgi:hypothetical protein
MRKLKAKDIAPFTKIIAKMELKDTLKATFGNAVNGEKTTKGSLVADLIWGIVENYGKAENDFFAFLADVNETTPDAISDMDLSDFIKLLQDLFSGDNISFFKSAAK